MGIIHIEDVYIIGLYQILLLLLFIEFILDECLLHTHNRTEMSRLYHHCRDTTAEISVSLDENLDQNLAFSVDHCW